MKTVKRSYNLAKVFAAVMAILISVAGCAATSTSKSTGEIVDDSVLTTKVNAALASDSLASALAVDVETYRGRVILSGFVDSEEQMETIVSIVEGVNGVEEVTNSLQIKPPAS